MLYIELGIVVKKLQLRLATFHCFDKPTRRATGIYIHCIFKPYFSNYNERTITQVNFSGKHNFYLSAYRYVCKSDQEVPHSENHLPRLLTAASPKTKKSVAGFRAACATKRKSTEGESSCAVAKKRKSLTNLDLAEFIRDRGIKSYTELLAIAEDQRTAGQMDITEFVFKRNEKIFREIVTKTWQMESAKEKLEAGKASQIDTVKT